MQSPWGGGALLVECKWTSRPVGVDVVRNLERKAVLAALALLLRKKPLRHGDYE